MKKSIIIIGIICIVVISSIIFLLIDNQKENVMMFNEDEIQEIMGTNFVLQGEEFTYDLDCTYVGYVSTAYPVYLTCESANGNSIELRDGGKSEELMIEKFKNLVKELGYNPEKLNINMVSSETI